MRETGFFYAVGLEEAGVKKEAIGALCYLSLNVVRCV